MGLPVVGTTSATQGVEARDGDEPPPLIVADDARSQAEAVCALLRDSQRARDLGRRARRFVEAHYDWEVVLAALDRILAPRTVPQS